MTTSEILERAIELAARSTTRFPNESAEYRAARTALLAEEIELRRHIQAVAASVAHCRRAARPRNTGFWTRMAKTSGCSTCSVDTRVCLGQTPAPVVNGMAVGARIGNGDNYGVVLYDPHDDERGGMVFIGDASRAAVVLDRPWPSADAIGLMVDDKTGFPGLEVMYAKGGQSGFELGTQGDAVSMTLSDPRGQKRAGLKVEGPEKPSWQFNGAATAASIGKP